MIVLLIAALGFAAVSIDAPADSPEEAAPTVESLQARVAAAGFAALLNPDIEQAIPAPVAAAPAPQVAAAPAAPPTTTTTTTTTSTTTTTTTTTTAPPPTTTAAPTTTTTPPTTTTAPPPTTTAAPATTTAPPETTTTAPNTTTTTVPPIEGGPRDVEEWRSVVELFFTAELVDGALAVIHCESRGDPLAYNPVSGASGLFQFIPSTWAWAAPGAGFGGASPFEPDANIATAAWLVQRSIDQGKAPWTHWTCQP